MVVDSDGDRGYTDISRPRKNFTSIISATIPDLKRNTCAADMDMLRLSRSGLSCSRAFGTPETIALANGHILAACVGMRRKSNEVNLNRMALQKD